MIKADGGEEDCGTFASPPCFMHEADPTYTGLVDATQARDVARWRKAERQRLISARLAAPIAEREALANRIAAALDRLLSSRSSRIISLYWPFKGEPDLRGWMEGVSRRGAGVALPVVVAKGAPLVFREWRPGARLERGVWNIPFPADGAVVIPDVVIAPLVGYDAACYRLGYGGGFFDRTLASLAPKALAIGVGYPASAIATIYPQSHDIPMDWIVTGEGAPRSRASASSSMR
jgi:5,10-methenyltetrahydrofolate synthetase